MTSGQSAVLRAVFHPTDPPLVSFSRKCNQSETWRSYVKVEWTSWESQVGLSGLRSHLEWMLLIPLPGPSHRTMPHHPAAVSISVIAHAPSPEICHWPNRNFLTQNAVYSPSQEVSNCLAGKGPWLPCLQVELTLGAICVAELLCDMRWGSCPGNMTTWLAL